MPLIEEIEVMTETWRGRWRMPLAWAVHLTRHLAWAVHLTRHLAWAVHEHDLQITTEQNKLKNDEIIEIVSLKDIFIVFVILNILPAFLKVEL